MCVKVKNTVTNRKGITVVTDSRPLEVSPSLTIVLEERVITNVIVTTTITITVITTTITTTIITFTVIMRKNTVTPNTITTNHYLALVESVLCTRRSRLQENKYQNKSIFRNINESQN